MSNKNLDSLDDLSMAELFRMEVESQSVILTDGLLALERGSGATQRLEELMRAAHSLKGAARIVGRSGAVRVAHAMESCFVAAQRDELNLSEERVDALLAAVDLLGRIAEVPDETFITWETEHRADLEALLASLALQANPAAGPVSRPVAELHPPSDQPSTVVSDSFQAAAIPPRSSRAEGTAQSNETAERILRVTTDNLNRLLGLAGEALVASRSLDAFATDMLRLKNLHGELARSFESFRESLTGVSLKDRTVRRLIELQDRVVGFEQSLLDRLADQDHFDRRFSSFSTRLYQEVLDCRMRPFADGIQAFPRTVRDLGRSLGKAVHLEVTGEYTTVDRDILERVKAPLDHLIRNAIDHGIEPPAERQRKGKPEQGTIQLEAHHSAGKLLITVTDDGRGIELEAIRQAVVEKKLTTLEIAQKMNQAELFDFLFLPGFTLKETVSEISGRGVGLDVVHAMVKEVGGSVRVSSQNGNGTRFQLELPLTLSVIRTLLVEIGDEPYAFPLARIDRALKLPREKIESVEGRQHFSHDGQQIGLVVGNEILELESQLSDNEVSIIVLGDKTSRYGLVVNRFLEERELVVRALDPRLGKVKNISAASLMPDGSPLLIVDVDDLIREIENFVSGRRLSRVAQNGAGDQMKPRKRVLIVDDSLTVRELERKLLDGRGYAVDMAVDGMEGWNAVRTGHYDLLVTDIDMPRMDGIGLVTLIRKDERLKSLPVMIVSYKDRQEDRQRGLEAGADYYLTKGSFHDETLIRAVADLIGAADS
jgi:two-component system sensor histidine kinase and response regulator WspE